MWIIAQFKGYTKNINADKFASVTTEENNEGGRIYFEDEKGHTAFYIPIICSKEDFEHIKGNITMSLGSDVTFIIPPEFLVH